MKAIASRVTNRMIDKSAIPGTVHLVDLNHNIAAKHARGQEDIVLIPTPSNDPDDPLNWAPRRKALSTVCLAVLEFPFTPLNRKLANSCRRYVLFVGMINSVVYSVLVPISEATNLSGKSYSKLGAYSNLTVTSERPECWNRILLSPLWMGFTLLATVRTTIRKTVDIPDLRSGQYSKNSTQSFNWQF